MLELDVRTRLGDLELAIELTVAAGECVALAGPSGAGKTSVLRIVAGLLRPDRGHVRCDEETWLDTDRRTALPVQRRQVGYVFQDYALFPNLNVWRNVAYGLRRLPRVRRREHALALLDRFGMRRLADARPATLSGGERQRVAIARTLAREPRVLLLDEPLSALDTRTRARASAELARVLKEAAHPSLLVSHDFEQAALLADRVAVIDSGAIVQVGHASALAASPRSGFVADMTGAVVLSGHARARDDGLTEISLDGGGVVTSTDPGAGAVAIAVHPWEITLEAISPTPVEGSASNRLGVKVTGITSIGGRVRVGLLGPQPLSADITEASALRLGLTAGSAVTATWKATATRVVSR